MWSPFAPIHSWLSAVLDLAARGVEALEGILGRLAALIDTINQFECPPSTDPLPTGDLTIDLLASRVEDLTIAVAEGVNNVQRSERRVRAVVASARRELAEAGYAHPGLEAEATQLVPDDGDERDQDGLPPVSTQLAVDSEIPGPIAGVSLKAMTVARARRGRRG